MDPTTLAGSRIRKARERKGWNLRQLGDATGFDFGYVGKIERGEASPDADTYYRITSALGISLASLFTAPQRPPSRSRTV